MVYYRPHNLQYHIRLCKKTCHRYRYWKKGTQNWPLWNPIYEIASAFFNSEEKFASNIELLKLWKINSGKISLLYLIIFTNYFLLFRLWIFAKILLFASKYFFILRWYSYFLLALKTGSVMCELALLPARVSSISNFSTSLLKCLSKVSASSSLLLIVLLLLFRIIDSLWKAFSEKRGPTFFQLLETTLWSSFPKNLF